MLPADNENSLPNVDEATIKARAAAARAYALSSDSNFEIPTPPGKTETIDIPPVSKTDPVFIPNIQDEDYAMFVKTLTDDDFFRSDNFDDDPDDFFVETMEEEDEEEEEDLPVDHVAESLFPSDTEDGSDPFTLETELGLLMEEDLENALTTMLSQHPPTPDNLTESRPCTPLRECSRNSTATVTQSQLSRLKRLMNQHYQLLVQQAVLSVRAVSKKHSHYGRESADDLADILDGAVGMLQDLDQNRKDAIRTSIQLKKAKNHNEDDSSDGRLTRAAFSKTLQKSEGETTTFDVAGLKHLKSLFATIDNTRNIAESSEPKQACIQLLQTSHYEKKLLPGVMEYSEILSQPKEFFGDEFKPPCVPQQIESLMRDRNQFTAAEDSLVFRGVNLYGETQWLLIADRFLPDRSTNIIRQRYAKLSLLLFKAHGVKIDENGCLAKAPKLDSVDKADQAALAALKRVEPPAILNVHRWSLEEDLTLLKGVSILGHMWAELSARLIPHRDRGHLRKRYQVLDRRIKGAVTKAKKEALRIAKKEERTAKNQEKSPLQPTKKRVTACSKLSSKASTGTKPSQKLSLIQKIVAEKPSSNGKILVETSTKHVLKSPPLKKKSNSPLSTERQSVSQKFLPSLPANKNDKSASKSPLAKSNIPCKLDLNGKNAKSDGKPSASTKSPPSLLAKNNDQDVSKALAAKSSIPCQKNLNEKNALSDGKLPKIKPSQNKQPPLLHPHTMSQRKKRSTSLFTKPSSTLSKNITAPKLPTESLEKIHGRKPLKNETNLPDDHSNGSGRSLLRVSSLSNSHFMPQHQGYQPIQPPSNDGHHQDSYSQEQFLIGHFEDTRESFSRYGVEQILNNDNLSENSQLIRVEELMKNDNSEKSFKSHVANTTSEHSKGSSRNYAAPTLAMDNLQKNLQIYHSEGSNCSYGLDMLAANAREAESPVRPAKESIMKSVFKRANRQDYQRTMQRNKSSPLRKAGPSPRLPSSRVIFSPNTASFQMSPPDSDFLFTKNSCNSFGFEISDVSRQILGTVTKLPSLESNSTIEDLNAASALNSLSNSPTISRLLTSAAKESGGVKRSLFDRAIKKPKQQNKKRKL